MIDLQSPMIRFIELRRLGKVVNDSNIYTRTTLKYDAIDNHADIILYGGFVVDIIPIYVYNNNNKLHVLRRDYCFYLRKQL